MQTRKNNMNGDVFIHPQAIVESSDIGAATRIWAFAHVLPGAKIGKNCNICDHTFIESDVIIGDNVTVKCGVYLWDGLRVEDSVFIGPNATFTNDPRPRSKAYPEKFAQTVLKTGCSIAVNATVLCPLTVGKFAMVGAGSVVTKDVPDYTIVFGNPAKSQGYICRCANKLSFENDHANCTCGKKYRLHNNRVEEIND
jgi:acetyltransferase-like isoleucine patch superfamily enzyme